MKLEVSFYNPDEASVFLESAVVESDKEKLSEIGLFAYFATRQVANLGQRDSIGWSLALALAGLVDESDLAAAVTQKLDTVQLVRASGKGRKGFRASFQSEPLHFKLTPYGFGILGRGVGYYAPTSTLVLLKYLLDRRADDAGYLRALGTAASHVGSAGAAGAIRATNQHHIALDALARATKA